jgi:hypothetical protein
MPATPTESTFELATIHRLHALGYRCASCAGEEHEDHYVDELLY